MSAGPPVSVVIPTYNRAALVGRAVLSALAAVAPGDEILVVDDGSTDDTARALAPYEGRVRYVRQGHAGAGRARNRGIEEAAHPVVAFLDSDDEWMPDTLGLGRQVLDARPDVLFTLAEFATHRAQGDRRKNLVDWHHDRRSWDEILGPGAPFSSLGRLSPGREDFRVHVGSLYRPLLRAPYVAANTALVRRTGPGRDVRYPEDLPTYEDWEYFARLARRGPAAFLDCELAWNWWHEGPRLTGADRFVRSSARITTLRRVWGADEEFLASHREAYEEVLREQHLARGRWLVEHGRTAQARRELAQAGAVPVSHRLAAALPGPVARGLLRARRRVKAWS